MYFIDIPGNVLVHLLYIGLFIFLLVVVISIKGLNFFRNIYLENLRISQQKRTKKAMKDMDDGKPHVLYLRPFSLDGFKSSEKEILLQQIKIKNIQFDNQVLTSHRFNFELQLVKTAEELGPFVSIGNIKGNSEDFGAVRFFYPDNVWKEHAAQLMEDAVMIVIRISSIVSDNLEWEIHQIRKKYLSKTVFFLDFQDDRSYNLFLQKIAQFNLSFPLSYDEMKYECFISFDETEKRFSSHVFYASPTFIRCKKIVRTDKHLTGKNSNFLRHTAVYALGDR